MTQHLVEEKTGLDWILPQRHCDLERTETLSKGKRGKRDELFDYFELQFETEPILNALTQRSPEQFSLRL